LLRELLGSGTLEAAAIGTGSPLNVSPFISSTYYVRAEGGACNNTTACAPVSITSSNGLVAYYAFENVSSNTLVDSTGHGFNATATKSVSTVSGQVGNALDMTSFMQSDADYAQNIPITNSQTYFSLPKFSIEAWVDLYEFAAGGILDGGPTDTGSSTKQGFYLGVDGSGYVQFSLPSSDGKSWVTIKSSSGIWRAGWTHVGATYDGTTMRLYVNGVFQTSQPISVAISLPKNAQIGLLQISANIYSEFLGYIDQLRIYNYKRSDGDMLTDAGTPQ
jgi:hypothetical protein